jgi:hypothetical protein
MVSQARHSFARMVGKLHSIDEVASGQWSLVTRKQLLDSDFERGQIASLIRTSVLRVALPGVYATIGSTPCWQQDLFASVLAAGEGAVASRASAARLWEYVYQPEEEINVLVKGDFTRGPRGTHRTTILPEEDVTTRSGIPCTSFERTLCDCTALLSAFQLGRVLDDGLRRGDASLARLERCAARLDSGRGRRLSVVKELLAQRDADFNPGGSGSELDILRIIRDAGLPVPVQQYPVVADGHRYVLDFAWPERMIFAEYYGLAFHSGASAVSHDNDRISALFGIGWRGVVFDETTPEHRIVKRLKRFLS